MDTQLKLEGVAEPSEVADSILVSFREAGELLTNLKLQKILYYADAWYLALRGEALVREDFEAWVHGPVLPSQYHRFKHHTWRQISDEISKPHLTTEVSEHLDEIIEVFGVESGVSLELMTHQEEPWIEARGDLDPTENSRNAISKETMARYYKSFSNVAN
jgi:uncharacterized phage-associated protein